jgi:hypothetical protein
MIKKPSHATVPVKCREKESCGGYNFNVGYYTAGAGNI